MFTYFILPSKTLTLISYECFLTVLATTCRKTQSFDNDNDAGIGCCVNYMHVLRTHKMSCLYLSQSCLSLQKSLSFLKVNAELPKDK